VKDDSPKVCCVVLTWNDRDNLAECLASMSKLKYPNLEIIVSDNGSTDGTIEFVKADYPDVVLLENGRNLFWAGGNNLGIQRAIEDGADYILLLNNDIVVDPEMVGALVEVGESDPRIGMLGPKIYYYGDDRQLWYAGGQVSLWRGIARHVGIRETDRGQYDEVVSTDYITGCALMVKREVVEKIGLVDPVYVAYGEDMDWSYRARLAGYQLDYVPAAVLWHKIGAYWGVVSKRKIRQKLRSHRIFFWRYSPRLAWFTTIPVFFVLDAVRVGFGILTGRFRGAER
jgi:GT2 family glycosyltransferase